MDVIIYRVTGEGNFANFGLRGGRRYCEAGRTIAAIRKIVVVGSLESLSRNLVASIADK